MDIDMQIARLHLAPRDDPTLAAHATCVTLRYGGISVTRTSLPVRDVESFFVLAVTTVLHAVEDLRGKLLYRGIEGLVLCAILLGMWTTMLGSRYPLSLGVGAAGFAGCLLCGYSAVTFAEALRDAVALGNGGRLAAFIDESMAKWVRDVQRDFARSNTTRD